MQVRYHDAKVQFLHLQGHGPDHYHGLVTARDIIDHLDILRLGELAHELGDLCEGYYKEPLIGMEMAYKEPYNDLYENHLDEMKELLKQIEVEQAIRVVWAEATRRARKARNGVSLAPDGPEGALTLTHGQEGALSVTDGPLAPVEESIWIWLKGKLGLVRRAGE